MTTKNNQPRKTNSDFGLPQTEFKPIAEGGSRWLKITAIITGIVLVIGLGVFYVFFYHTPTAPPKETYPVQETYESELPQTKIDFIEDDVPTVAKEQNAQTQEFEKLETLQPASEKGTITKINAPQGCHYIIVKSFIDEDLASDYADRLAQQGVDVMLIAPIQDKLFFNIAVEQADTPHEANEKVAALTATYGKDIWVMQY